jgi:transposase
MFKELNDDEWERVAPLAVDEPVHPHRRGRPRAETRVVANAVLWILTTGERWSKLPARYPSEPTCRRRFDEWLADGTLIEMIKILSESGRSFTYIPQPAAFPAPKRASTLESPRLRGVFWPNLESWREADSCSYRAGDLPIASSRPLQTGSDARISMRKREHEAPAFNDATAHKRTEDYRGYTIHAMAQRVTRQMNLSYRASAEILKGDRRIERSGLIGPCFADLESAEHHALNWARDWIDRQASAAAPAAAAVSSTGGAVRLDGNEAVVRSLPATRGELTPAAACKLEPDVTCGATDWLLHPDGRGDAKPPELVYHA